ncbi:MAG: hypothetical protein HZY76_20940 [Anaerolineae bacterium]|nr:MAG: hypothetical protein HZY76_20940 [Anaerolineae bacterium]
MSQQRELIQAIDTRIASLITAIARTRAIHSRFLEWATEQEMADRASAEQEAQQALDVAQAHCRETLAEADSRHVERITQLDAWRDQTLSDTRSRSSRLIADAESTHDHTARRLEDEHQGALEATATTYEATVSSAENEHRQRCSNSQVAYDQAMTQALQSYDASFANTLEAEQAVLVSAG